MPRQNLISWVVMISGFAQNNQPKEALSSFRKMQILDKEPNSAMMVSVLSTCSQLGDLDHGIWIHLYIRKKHMELDAILSATLNRYVCEMWLLRSRDASLLFFKQEGCFDIYSCNFWAGNERAKQ